MQPLVSGVFRALCCLVLLANPGVAATLCAAEPVALRVESFTVSPSTQPLVYVQVKNLQTGPYEGTVSIKAPDGWQFSATKRAVSLEPGATGRVSFAVERGIDRQTNSYPIEVAAAGAGKTVVRKQNVATASAPYFKPEIDGDPGDWKDAIPFSFTTGGKKTVISTFWNRRQFLLLVAVEEDKLVGFRSSGGFDAVQVAMSPQETTTGKSPEDEATRFEFLFVAADGGTGGKCFQLAEPGMKLAEGAKTRELQPLLYEKAQVAVGRKGGVTYYECGIPFRPIRGKIRPSEGREFYLSLLVHDPDGTGIRDWGEAVGLWPWQRNRLVWSCFQGAQLGDKPPFDNKTQWGLCASKY